MSERIQLLDCTLRDGAYIVDSVFGTPAIKGIIKKMQNANVDIIECGWLKDKEHVEGTTFYHVPQDMEQYLSEKSEHSIYVAMIDYNRYDMENLPPYDGKSIDAIRVVFPHGKHREGIEVGKRVVEKGYKLYLQAANTLAYTDEELVELAEAINEAHPIAISVVDTFGAMYGDDLRRIVTKLDQNLDEDIKLGFHSHNNQQLSFALSIQFLEILYASKRDIMIDASLCGMGRGAGNTTTELMANYLNQKYEGNYDMNAIMDAIDTYMGYFNENFQWGYSTSYFIAGMYCAHVNNIAYLLNNHRTNAMDMRNIIGALSQEERKTYDYDLLEKKYLEYQNKIVDDEQTLKELKDSLKGRNVLLISPGKTIETQKERIMEYQKKYNPIVIGINAISLEYEYDYLFFSNKIRYEYARDIYTDIFDTTDRILTSNIKTDEDASEKIVNFNLLIKQGWKHFDNAMIMCLRLMNKLHIPKIALAGFDGFKDDYADNYSDVSLPSLKADNQWSDLNTEIQSMFDDFKATTTKSMEIEFITDSMFE